MMKVRECRYSTVLLKEHCKGQKGKTLISKVMSNLSLDSMLYMRFYYFKKWLTS